MIEPIPDADEADIAEQTRSVVDYRSTEFRENWNADAPDILEQQLAVSGDEDERPYGGAGVNAELPAP